MMPRNIEHILDEFLLHKAAGPDVILCADPFLKCVFLEKLTHHTNRGIIYLDFDMLYSGYVNSGVFEIPDNVLIRRPGLTDWREEITSIVQITSTHEYLIIIDSLNGMTTTLKRRNLALHSIMLMTSLGVTVNTRVVSAAITKKPIGKWKIPGSHTSLTSATHVLDVIDNTARLKKVI